MVSGASTTVRVLLTGASGFVGRNLLLQAPATWDITAIYSADPSFPAWSAQHCGPNVRPVRRDLAAPDAALALRQLGAFDVVLHFAGKVRVADSVAEPWPDLAANGGGALAVAAGARCRHLIYLSSGAVYEGQHGRASSAIPLEPTLPYAIHKLLGERYTAAAVERFGTARAATILRFFGAYGPYEPDFKIYTRLVRRFAMERVPSFDVYGDGSNLIDAMWVGDAVRGLLAVVDAPPPDGATRTWDLAAGSPMSIGDLVTRAGRHFLGHVELRCEGIAHERNAFEGDPGPLAAATGFRATTSLEDGLGSLAAFLGATARA